MRCATPQWPAPMTLWPPAAWPMYGARHADEAARSAAARGHCPCAGASAVRHRWPALSGRHQLLVGESVRPQPPHVKAALAEQLESLDHVMLAGFHTCAGGAVVEAPGRAHGSGPCVLRQRWRCGHRDRAQNERASLAQHRPPGQAPLVGLTGCHHGKTVGALAVARHRAVSRRLRPAGAPGRHHAPS